MTGRSLGTVTLQLPWGAPLTYNDLRNIPEDGHRYELLDGALLVTPAPNRAHQRCVLAVEVLSPSTRRIDLVLKREAYAAAGVASYWIVDPEVPSVTFLRLEGSGYVEEGSVAGEDPFAASVPFPVAVMPARLLD
jgi:Putative restriction endonuclease